MRYVATITVYVLADSDEEAHVQADLLAEEIRYSEDNNARVEAIHEQPFGTTENREVKL